MNRISVLHFVAFIPLYESSMHILHVCFKSVLFFVLKSICIDVLL